MWVERLEIQGFRRLAGLYRLSPRLTVVQGDNEAGKSSLHEALVRALVGYSKADRRRSEGRSLLDTDAPWSGGPFGLVATVRAAPYGIERIEWDFGRHAVRVYDGLGTELGERVRRRGQEVELAPVLLELDAEDFRAVCCLDQRSIHGVPASSSLEAALIDAVANVGHDTAAEGAVERLEGGLRALGVNVRTLQPNTEGRLASLRAGVLEQRQRLDAARRVRIELEALAADRDRALVERDRARARQEAVARVQLTAEAEALADRLAKVRRLVPIAAHAGELETTPDLSALGPALAARAALDAAEVALARADRDSSRSIEALADLERRLEAAERTLAALPPPAAVDPAARPEVGRLVAELGAVRADEPSVPRLVPPDPSLVAFQAERPDLAALAAASERPVLRGPRWVLVVVVTLGLALLWRRLRGDSSAGRALAERLAAYGASSLAELDERAAAEDRSHAASAALVADASERRMRWLERRAGVERRLVDRLEQAAAAADGDPEQRAAAYLEACAGLDERSAAEAACDRERAVLEAAQEPMRVRAMRADDRAAAAAKLVRALSALGAEASDEGEARHALTRLVAAAQVAAERGEQARLASERLGALLDGTSESALAGLADRALERLEEHRARWGDLGDHGARDAAAADVARPALVAAEHAATTLDARVEALERGAPDPVALTEELALAEAELERLEAERDALALARDAVREAAGELAREFAPELGAALAAALPRLTGGRYEEARVDPSLGVKVVAPETGQLVAVEHLSRATRDQIYLVQRLVIARLLARRGTGENALPPLLLDDPFARYDPDRLRRGLELLGEVADERQVVLFTEDAALVDQARETLDELVVIELPSPAAAHALSA